MARNIAVAIFDGFKFAGADRHRILREEVPDISRDRGIEFGVSRDGKSRVGMQVLARCRGMVIGVEYLPVLGPGPLLR